MTREAGSKDPLHGITLKALVTQLVEHYGWAALGQKVRINCFTQDPSINSSLKFLRKTPWAREKVEALYIHTDFSKEPVLQKAASTSKQVWPDWPKKR